MPGRRLRRASIERGNENGVAAWVGWPGVGQGSRRAVLWTPAPRRLHHPAVAVPKLGNCGLRAAVFYMAERNIPVG